MSEPGRLSRTQRYKRTINGLRTDLDNMTKVATELYGIIQSGGGDQQYRADMVITGNLDNAFRQAVLGGQNGPLSSGLPSIMP